MPRAPLTPEQVRALQQADANRDLERRQIAVPTVVTPTPPTLPAIPAIEGADAYLERNPQMMVGRTIKPNGKAGTISFVDDETPVPADLAFIVLTDSIWCGYARLEEGQQVQYAGGLLFSPKGFRRASREELGDTDPIAWPLGKFDDLPSDPWKECILVPLEEREAGELYTLQIISKPRSAAIFAIDGLLRHCQALMRRSPDMCPVIRLKMSQYESKKFGMQWKPNFQVVGKAPRASAAKPDTSLAADLNDAIPTFS